jgi:hypothetical protein
MIAVKDFLIVSMVFRFSLTCLVLRFAASKASPYFLENLGSASDKLEHARRRSTLGKTHSK